MFIIKCSTFYLWNHNLKKLKYTKLLVNKYFVWLDEYVMEVEKYTNRTVGNVVVMSYKWTRVKKP